MHVFVTGATGYIGGAVSRALLRAGHEVIGLARSEEKARVLEAQGVRRWWGDLSDPETLAGGARDADATIHAALRPDPNAPIADRAAAETILELYAGTRKAFIYTSGVWVMGNTESGAGEDAPTAPPPAVAWRVGVEKLVLDAASRDIRTCVIRPAMVWGRGRGIPANFFKSARETGAAIVVGSGENHWSFVHIDDLADLYVRALDAAPGMLLIAAAESHRVRDVAAAASKAAGAGGKVQTLDVDEAYNTMGPWVKGLILDQRVTGDRARRLLGWRPVAHSILEEYAKRDAAA